MVMVGFKILIPCALPVLAASFFIHPTTRSDPFIAKRTNVRSSRNVVRAGYSDGIPPSPAERSLAVNLDPSFYGSFAEIGAGQEVSRYFLRAGAAAGTVARSVSAYDMKVSDRMYGESSRYVTQERMMQMIEQEYKEVEGTLREVKGPDCRFFSFASTIAAKAYMSDRECEAYIGIMYQKEAGAELSTVWLHARMTDSTAELQGDALGVLGANLVYLVSKAEHDEKTIIKNLMADINPGRLTVNWVGFEGAGWDVDSRLCALWLVQYGLTEAVLFQPEDERAVLGNRWFKATVPNLAFYKRPILVQRGRFRFVTKSNEAIFQSGLAKLKSDTGHDSKKTREPLSVVELMITPFGNSDKALSYDAPKEAEKDFISRFNVLSSLRKPILISGLGEMHTLATYMSRYTNEQIVIAVGGGSYSLDRGICSDRECQGLKGGLLEAFGRLFAKGVKLYVFPNISPDGKVTSCVEKSANSMEKETLLSHLRATSKLVPIENKFIPEIVLNETTNQPFRGETQQVLDMICKFDAGWKELVPEDVVTVVNEKGIGEVFSMGSLKGSSSGGAAAVSALEQCAYDFHDAN